MPRSGRNDGEAASRSRNSEGRMAPLTVRTAMQVSGASTAIYGEAKFLPYNDPIHRAAASDLDLLKRPDRRLRCNCWLDRFLVVHFATLNVKCSGTTIYEVESRS